MQLTEKEAWQMIGEAFEAKAAHPDLPISDYSMTDLAGSGLCFATGTLRQRDLITHDMERAMDARTNAEVGMQGAFLSPASFTPEGVEVRAMLAYLFAESAE
jgi:hypothetical protein